MDDGHTIDDVAVPEHGRIHVVRDEQHQQRCRRQDSSVIARPHSSHLENAKLRHFFITVKCKHQSLNNIHLPAGAIGMARITNILIDN